MRILRLKLLRYGPFTDKVVDLRPGAQLHLVYGPNEAGKSSSLAAIGDLLFGFSSRREYDFLHDAQSLRVGAEIVSESGEVLAFRRRRGKKKTLLADDETETALHDDALAPFIGSLDRAVFSRAFGLNSEWLRQGGEAMLDSEGEVGAALFAASSGLTGLARIRRGLDAEADAIFAPRPSKDRRFYQALDRYDTAIAAERRNELRSGDWKTLLTGIADIEAQLATIRLERGEVTAALARLRRLGVLEPILRAIDQLEREAEQFGDLPEVTDGFLTQCAAALDATEDASGQAQAAIEDVADASAALRSIVVNEEALARADRIIEAFSRKGDYLSKLADCPRIEAERDGFSITLAEHALGLGFADLDDLVAQLPSAAVLASARAMIETGLAIETDIAADEKRLREEKANLRLHQATGASEGLIDPKPWREQLAALGPDLKELGEQSYLESSYRNLRQKLADTAMRLVPQIPDIDELSGAMLPTRAALELHKAEFERLLTEHRETVLRLAANTRQREETWQKRVEIEQGGPTSYEATIQLVRAERDAIFRLLHDHLLRVGRLMAPNEVTERLVEFEEQGAEADRLADRAIADADRISRLGGYDDQLAELDRQHPLIEQRLAELEAEQAEAFEVYAAAFAPAGVAPMGPEAMLGWLSSVEELLVARRDLEALDAQIASLALLGQQVHGALLGIARHIGVVGADALPPLALSRLIAATLEELTARWGDQLTFEGARQAARTRIRQIEDGLAGAWRRYGEWRENLEHLFAPLGLDSATTTAGAAAALAIWEAVPDASRERANRIARIEGMRRDITAFEADVMALAGELTPVLLHLPAEGLIGVLREQAETARGAKGRQDDARARLEQAEKRLADARGTEEASNIALRALASRLPEGADPRAELIRLERRRDLRAQLAGRHKDFDMHAEGFSEAAIRNEMPGFKRERAPLDAEDLERRGDSLHAENNRLYALLGQRQAQRETFESGSGSELAAFERQSAEAEIVVAARQWAVRKIAALMLGAAIEKHREAQSDPLMLRAGALFATLTSGSFSGLLQDYGEDDRPRLVGVRNDGQRVAIAGMSEGTRDQLYLALRLAYIEDYADRTEPVPFIGDDIFQTFDDERTAAGIEALASTASLFQPILFTHHLSVVAIAKRTLGDGLDYIEL